jgi:hypothetical protein
MTRSGESGEKPPERADEAVPGIGCTARETTF